MDLDLWDCFGRKKNSVLKLKKTVLLMNRLNYTESAIFIFLVYSLLQKDLTIQNLSELLRVKTYRTVKMQTSQAECYVGAVCMLPQKDLPYFFGYKTEFFPSKTIPKI